MWEDEANVNGGKWIVRLKKGLAARYWEDVLLAILGGQFRVGDEICGCVLSVRYQEDILSIWNRSADSRRVCFQIRDTMRSVMGLPLEATMECAACLTPICCLAVLLPMLTLRRARTGAPAKAHHAWHRAATGTHCPLLCLCRICCRQEAH